MTPEQWASLYRGALPDQLRPHRGSERLELAAFDAISNGWPPEAVAALVARRSYSGANSPPAVALGKLEEIVARPRTTTPKQGRGPQRNRGCLVCPWHVPCVDPITAADLIPDDWTRERFHVLRELMAASSAELSEDEREERMRLLIADQRARPRATT